MTKESLLKWVRKSYSIAEIGVDGIATVERKYDKKCHFVLKFQESEDK